jgi:hypothetical protein
VFGSEVLDVVIGILFVYLTLSLICSAVQELIAGFLRLRARYLYDGVRRLLDDPSGGKFVRDFYNHPLVNALFPGAFEPGVHRNLPSYIPARTFALAVMDLVAPPAQPGDSSGAAGTTSVSMVSPSIGFVAPESLRLRNALTTTPSVLPPALSRALLTLLDAAGGDPIKTRENIEQWYDNAMERVSSAYKRRTQALILVIGVLVAAAVNADSINLVTTLSTNKAVRDSLVAASAQIPKAAPGTSDATAAAGEFETNLKRIRNSGLPFGWVAKSAAGELRGVPGDPSSWIQKAIGLLLTVAAISLGAPFWFDVLNKLAVIRSAVKPAEPGPPMTSKG